MLRSFKLLVTASVLAAPLLVASTASAGPEACGNIDVSANATCEVRADCAASCTPVTFEAACSAKLVVQCDGMCTATLPSCEVDCSADCAAECSGQAQFDCQGSCEADCDGNCEGHCSGSGNHGECVASCRSTCQSHCSSSCSGSANASCSASCQASCQGSCNGEANIDCQVACQSKGYAKCEADLQGGCNVECSGDGAMFCDGQYVDHGGNLQACKDYLASIGVEVRYSGSCESGNGSASCEAEASASCSAAPTLPTDLDAPWLAAAALGGLGLVFGRRRGKKSA